MWGTNPPEGFECGSNETPIFSEGQWVCRDDLDDTIRPPDDDDDGRPIYTPDGPPCPPCPEGVEAGWCADEDERQDTDDCPDEKPGDECYVNDVEENEEEPEEIELEEQEEEEEEEEEEESSGNDNEGEGEQEE